MSAAIWSSLEREAPTPMTDTERQEAVPRSRGRAGAIDGSEGNEEVEGGSGAAELWLIVQWSNARSAVAAGAAQLALKPRSRARSRRSCAPESRPAGKRQRCSPPLSGESIVRCERCRSLNYDW
jgi:hypothetical protein